MVIFLFLRNVSATVIPSLALPMSIVGTFSAMYLLGLKYFEALPKMAEGKGSTVFLPAEATGVMGAVGALREMLNKASTNPTENPSNTRRASGPVSAYPATRPTIAVRAADTQVPLPDNPTER